MLGAEGGEHEGSSCFYSLLFNERNKYLPKNICVLGCGPRVRLEPALWLHCHLLCPGRDAMTATCPRSFLWQGFQGLSFCCSVHPGAGSEL